eukprot:10907934-Karenia_brevis.AAC.1
MMIVTKHVGTRTRWCMLYTHARAVCTVGATISTGCPLLPVLLLLLLMLLQEEKEAAEKKVEAAAACAPEARQAEAFHHMPSPDIATLTNHLNHLTCEFSYDKHSNNKMRPKKLVSYNVLNLFRASRAQDICAKLQWADVVCLMGTHDRSDEKRPI